jgi:hypothetical protein
MQINLTPNCKCLQQIYSIGPGPGLLCKALHCSELSLLSVNMALNDGVCSRHCVFWSTSKNADRQNVDFQNFELKFQHHIFMYLACSTLREPNQMLLGFHPTPPVGFHTGSVM